MLKALQYWINTIFSPLFIAAPSVTFLSNRTNLLQMTVNFVVCPWWQTDYANIHLIKIEIMDCQFEF